MENRTKENLPNFRIKLKMESRTFIKQIQQLVYEDFGIKLTGPYTDEGLYWYIQGAKKCSLNANNRKLFIHPIKEWRLRKICEMGS